MTLTMWAAKDGFGLILFDTLSKLRNDAIELSIRGTALTWKERQKMHGYSTTRVKIQVL